MNTNERKKKLVARLVRNSVPVSIANALAQSGLLAYEQSLAVHGADIRKQAMSAYEAAPDKAAVVRVWNADRMAFDYELRTADRTLTFSSIRELRAHVWLCDEAIFRLAAYGRELRTLTREASK